MVANKRVFVIKCSLIILLLYLFVYLLNSSGTSNIIRSLQQSGRNLAAMEPKLSSQQQQVEQQAQQAASSTSPSAIYVHSGYDVPTIVDSKAITTEQLQQIKTGMKQEQSASSSTVRTPTVYEKVRNVTGCVDRPLRRMAQQRGDYWVLYNYVQAKRTFACDESITYTTHADYSFLDNLVPLVEKWKGPISLALHAPGADFKSTLNGIWYLRDCTTPLIKELVTFHIYFSTKHIPKEVSIESKMIDTFACYHRIKILCQIKFSCIQKFRSKLNLVKSAVLHLLRLDLPFNCCIRTTDFHKRI